MPKKWSTLLTMQDYPPLSVRFWYILIVLAVHKSRAGICFELGILNDPRQAGRVVLHDLPAVLAPKSPLARFMESAFGVRLSERQSVDLAQFVGRQLAARFDKGAEGCLQAIVDVRPCAQPAVQAAQVNGTSNNKEQGDGLGQGH